MKPKNGISLLITLICFLFSFPETGLSQAVTPAAIGNPANFCALPDAQVYVGGVFWHRDETIYYRCSRVLGRDAQPSGVAWVAGDKINSAFFLSTKPTVGGQCTRPGNLRYTVGAAVVFGGSTYRCSDILGADLKPTGVAWVEVEVRENNTFIVK